MEIMNNDYKIKDISLAEFGRQEILLAQDEMPALMQLRADYKDDQPLEVPKLWAVTLVFKLQF